MKAMKIVKRVIIIAVSCVLAVILLCLGVVYGQYLYYQNFLDWEDYQIGPVGTWRDDDEKEDMLKLREEGYLINVPGWSREMDPGKLIDCYAELSGACKNYGWFVARKYRNKAKLNTEVEVTSETVTIKFTGTGYNPDGTEDDLARTYIFDVDGAGKNKLPRLINKADIFPEL